MLLKHLIGCEAAAPRTSRVPRDITCPGLIFIVRTNVQYSIDRFTFQNEPMCFVQLADSTQTTKAIDVINKSQPFERVTARLLYPDFAWGQGRAQENDRFVSYDDAGIDQAVRPMIEGRRVVIRVKTPGWSNKNVGIREAKVILRNTFEQFGIESIGAIAPNFGDKKLAPRFLALMDFTTKKGAEAAIEAVHGNEVEGRLVWVEPSILTALKAQQLRKLAPAQLKEMQAKGIAPADEDIDSVKKYTKRPRGQKKPREQKKSKA